MRITITARHFRAPEALKAFVRDEVSRLERYYEGAMSSDVILSWEKLSQVAEITLKVSRQNLAALEKSEDMRKSITLAVEKLERQLKKLKGKKQTRSKSGAKNLDGAPSKKNSRSFQAELT
jgi:putative sigma-54 modulation protein